MSLSQKDIEDLAAFYNSLSMSKKDFDLELAKKGEALYRGGNNKGVAAVLLAMVRLAKVTLELAILLLLDNMLNIQNLL